MKTKNNFSKRIRIKLAKMLKEDSLCDCGNRKARLIFACNECVPTAYFPKGVKKAKELLKRYMMLDKEYQKVIRGCEKSEESHNHGGNVG